MLNKNNIRELCYVVKVDEIKPIIGRDRVECAVVNGWTVMVRKGQFHVGDLGVYFEIDSKVPEKEPFMFLESKHFKIKTQKYKTPNGQFWSQGLLMSFEDFGWEKNKYKLGDFLTKELGVVYAEAEDNKRKAKSVDKYAKMAQRNPKIFKRKWARWFMKRKWGKQLMFLIFGKKKDKVDTFPSWVKKTDEERVENMNWILEKKTPFIATEKIDGTSTTFTAKRGHFGKIDFFVCSRNVVFTASKQDCYYSTNVYLEMAQKYNIETVLRTILKQHPEYKWVTLQGETYGEGIQKRNYGLNEHRFAGFNFITSTEGRWNSIKAAEYLKEFNIPWVPILNESYTLPDTIEELRAFSHSEGSRIDGVIKEGIVFRSEDGVISFKCVDPDFLVKYHN